MYLIRKFSGNELRLLMPGILIIALLFLPGCRGCSRSGRESLQSQNIRIEKEQGDSTRHTQTAGVENIIKMRHSNGIYYIPLRVNGLEMEFIFDTGASIISISLSEAEILRKEGKLLDNDILGTSYYADATGRISEGTRLNLREIEIGNRTLFNVEASVVHNLEAPLLLGQSALNQFGRITIDYENKELILE